VFKGVVQLQESDNLKNAISDYVESLRDEQKKDKLIEDSSNNKSKQKGGFFELVSKLKKIIEMTCIGEKIRVETDEKNYLISVYGEDLSEIVKQEGSAIEALEVIINLIGRRKDLIEKRVVLDIKDYRKNNIPKIEKIAMKMAKKAINERKKVTLRPMPSFERKVVHNLLSKMNEIKTKSRNDEPNRRIVIYPVNQKNN
jgi:spoIIIJ-associated protein